MGCSGCRKAAGHPVAVPAAISRWDHPDRAGAWPGSIGLELAAVPAGAVIVTTLDPGSTGAVDAVELVAHSAESTDVTGSSLPFHAGRRVSGCR